MAILLTGAAGFIGHHVAAALLARGEAVLGIDSLNDYYCVRLKRDRLAVLEQAPGFAFRHVDFADHAALDAAVAGTPIDRIIHLGAQPGVRYSLENPRAYAQSNLVGHLNVLELARRLGVVHLVYASSSSVYGGNVRLPFSVDDRVDHPVSLYAATKKADELMSESYAHLFGLPQTGLRFFTVYGAWGRPDMAPWLFTAAILEGRPIALNNGGEMYRDFTHVDDIVAGVLAALDRPPARDGSIKPGGSVAPHAIYNLGNDRPERLTALVEAIEAATGMRAVTRDAPVPAGDVLATQAELTASRRDLGFAPRVGLAEGITRFVAWYRDYHRVREDASHQ